MHERAAFGFLRRRAETLRKEAPLYAMFLLTCSFEEVSASCRLTRTEEDPLEEFLLISSDIQSFQKTFNFEVKV
jgi:hypothetical protein